ncbi:MAG: HD domain-containing protein [Parvibaculaceae bacterium]|nr:HD domain-containing protein [Parvibaculaceae bacterium]|tara:strand:+ start:221 stop:820 length:600 start_codon:yes stop_codon:yes gene_type:complete
MSDKIIDGRATFKTMADSSQEEWQLIAASNGEFSKGLPDRVLAHLKLLDGDFGGFAVDRLEHSLQSATLAHRAGKDEEYVVCALLHDIGDTLGTFNHAEIGAAILKPFVSEDNHWMLEHHGIFQGYYFFHHIGLDRDMRDEYRGHQAFEHTAQFCHLFDQNAFDPNYDTMPLDAFEPMVQRVMERPRASIYKGSAAAAE